MLQCMGLKEKLLATLLCGFEVQHGRFHICWRLHVDDLVCARSSGVIEYAIHHTVVRSYGKVFSFFDKLASPDTFRTLFPSPWP